MNEKIRTREFFEATPPSVRPFAAYEALLNLTEQELENADILDLGAGVSEQFKHGLEEKKIKARVFSVNPMAGPETRKAKAVRSMSGKEKVIAAVAQDLPFKNKSFDLIISLAAIPLWLPATDIDFEKTFFEIDRILKDGGKAKLFPVWSKEDQLLKKSLGFLAAKGYKILWQEVASGVGQEFGLDEGFLLILEKPKDDK